MAKQRMAIAQGFKTSFDMLREAMPEAGMVEITALLMQTNQNDMMTTAASTGKATVIFIPLSMGPVSQVANLLPHDVGNQMAGS